MSKRTFLKIIAFVVGLYFVLEYLLPEKIGGDFNNYEVEAPTMLDTENGKLIFYVGKYSKNQNAIGVLQNQKDNTWLNYEKPILQKSLFVPHDKFGFLQPTAVAVSNQISLIYLGVNADRENVVCYAETADYGKNWKRGVVLFSTNGLPAMPTISAPNGRLPGRISAITAKYANENWHIFIMASKRSGERGIWYASGNTLTNINVMNETICNAKDYPQEIIAFDAYESSNCWVLAFLSPIEGTNLTMISSYEWNGGTAFVSEQTMTNSVVVTGFKMFSHDKAVLSWKQPKASHSPEESPNKTYIGESDRMISTTPTEIISTGAAAIPTYFSRGIKLANEFIVIITSFVVFIAIINLVMFHGKKIINNEKGIHNSIIFFTFIITMAFFTTLGGPDIKEPGKWGEYFDFVFNSIQKPMGIAAYSMITFFIVSSAYRSFKVRSAEAGLLMISAIIVMLGQLPLGELLAQKLPSMLDFLGLPQLSKFILNVINASAYRGVVIGTLIGGLSISLRIWLGIDNSVYTGLEGDKK